VVSFTGLDKRNYILQLTQVGVEFSTTARYNAAVAVGFLWHMPWPGDFRIDVLNDNGGLVGHICANTQTEFRIELNETLLDSARLCDPPDKFYTQAIAITIGVIVGLCLVAAVAFVLRSVVFRKGKTDEGYQEVITRQGSVYTERDGGVT
jgi:hypothetical protein